MLDNISIFILKLEIYCQERFRELNELNIFVTHRATYVWNKLPIKVEKFKIELHQFKNNVKKNNWRGNFGKYRLAY